ncbi:MAG: tetratricopeptide repeat protein [Burkholderiales bacterium]
MSILASSSSSAPVPATPATNTAPVTDVTEATFDAEVMETSMRMPVVIDFWAPWCGPCRTLSPVLEKLATEFAGRIKVVKINSDENMGLSQAFGVRSIPMVAALVGGQIAAQFMGAKPEGQVRQFFEQVMKVFAQALPDAARALAETSNTAPTPPPSPAASKHAEALARAERGDIEGALATLEEALKLDPALTDAHLDAAELEIAAERMEAAAARLAAIELKPGERDRLGRLDSLKARVQALDAVRDLPATEELEHSLAANPADHKLRFDLAHALIAEGAFEAGLEHLLHIVMHDRNWNEQGARRAMINTFNLLADNEAAADLVSAWRRKLASALN